MEELMANNKKAEIKSSLIRNYLKYKWVKLPNQKAEIGKMYKNAMKQIIIQLYTTYKRLTLDLKE